MFKGNITVLPITEDTGLFISGILENSLVSDSSNTGYRDFKYVQNKNIEGSYFEFNSKYPQTFGKYHINTVQQVGIYLLYLINIKQTTFI
jgi:hypothetical protein